MSEIELKPCPNPECQSDNLTRPNLYWAGAEDCINCNKCLLFGPDGCGEEEMVRLWNALPRATDVTAAARMLLELSKTFTGYDEYNRCVPEGYTDAWDALKAALGGEAELQSQGHWTAEPPTEGGYYWFLSPTKTPRILNVFHNKFHGLLACSEIDDLNSLAKFDGKWWSEPIRLPEPPTG